MAVYFPKGYEERCYDSIKTAASEALLCAPSVPSAMEGKQKGADWPSLARDGSRWLTSRGGYALLRCPSSLDLREAFNQILDQVLEVLDTG